MSASRGLPEEDSPYASLMRSLGLGGGDEHPRHNRRGRRLEARYADDAEMMRYQQHLQDPDRDWDPENHPVHRVTEERRALEDDMQLQSVVRASVRHALRKQVYDSVSDRCFGPCVGTPGEVFGKVEEKCLRECSEKYFFARMLVARSVFDHQSEIAVKTKVLE